MNIYIKEKENHILQNLTNFDEKTMLKILKRIIFLKDSNINTDLYKLTKDSKLKKIYTYFNLAELIYYILPFIHVYFFDILIENEKSIKKEKLLKISDIYIDLLSNIIASSSLIKDSKIILENKNILFTLFQKITNKTIDFLFF